MQKINQEEYEILKKLDDKWKWIARNYNGALITYTDKPMKNPNLYWDSFGERMDDRLFQFIQWEDESPYNIQELIEEYLYDNRPKLFIDGQEQSFEFIEESEEEEMKKGIEWLKDILFDENVIRLFPNDIEKLHELINQLDEPEVLSQKWIDENKEMYLINDTSENAVPVYKLQNLLVPKQELPVIPKFVADWIEEMKQDERPLYSVMSSLMNKTNHEWAVWKSANKDFSEIVAQAWLDGYTVEEEQKYYVLDKENATLLKKSAVGEGVAKSVGTNIYNAKSWKNEENYQLTEQEIKDYDERYFAFAVKVEELEEC